MKPGRRCRHMWWCLFEAWAPPETLFTFLQPPDVTTFKVSFFNHIKLWIRKCSTPQLDIKISSSYIPPVLTWPASPAFSQAVETKPSSMAEPSSQAELPGLRLQRLRHTKHYNANTPNTTMPTHNTHQTLQCKTHQYKEAMLHRGLCTCQMDTCCALQRRGGVEQRASLLCRVKPSRMCCKVECCMYIVV